MCCMAGQDSLRAACELYLKPQWHIKADESDNIIMIMVLNSFLNPFLYHNLELLARFC